MMKLENRGEAEPKLSKRDEDLTMTELIVGELRNC